MQTNKMVFLAVLVLMVGVLLGCQSMPERTKIHSGTAYNPQASEINVQLGMAYLKKGLRERAKSKLLFALDQNPQSAMANEAMAYFLEGAGDTVGAEQLYRQAVNYYPRKGEVLNNYGAFLCRQKRYDEALHYFKKAVRDRHYVDSSDAYENAGICSMEAKEDAEAITYFEQALGQTPDRARSPFNLSVLYYRAKDYRKAKEFFAQYRKIAVLTEQSKAFGRQLSKASIHQQQRAGSEIK